MEAAFDLFAEGGASAVSKRAVCARARLNDRYFHESFADTNALLEAIVRDQTELVLQAVSAVVVKPGDLHAQIRAIAAIALEFLASDPRRAALVLGSRGSEVLQRARIDSAWALTDAISAIGDDGTGGSSKANRLNRQVAAYGLVTGATEVIEAWLRGEIETGPEHLADLVASLLAAAPAITATLPSASPRRRATLGLRHA
jgi:AcrR family transcriptional regulator